ncbi:hypothetical protein HHI36_006202 [Cryptolaemus montrouzieri]|uniref:Multifunctional fusion protein n=1 Tax=Cryptolaemus montrouzieri TaxID=559131 RepID=A0ABD2NXB2_9CUCU
MFLDRRERVRDIHSNVNHHNNRIGRMVVKDSMQIKCKCHGMSGSCEFKTCWRIVPDIRIIGSILHEKYRNAMLFSLSNRGHKKLKLKNGNQPFTPQRKRRRSREKEKIELHKNLIYYQKSPSYCDIDNSVDFPGTSGRICNRTSEGADNCSSLCCGRGYNLLRRIRTEFCNCKFEWCCEVKCQNCTIDEWISYLETKMSTSLAEQLQRLARPQTTNLDRGKKRASLLFDPKEAAGLRKETVFEIGLNGLEELISKNKSFEQYTNTLFSLSSKEFERSVETAESNEKLDKHIRKFLLLLSPYFLLNCTYKALEWLIYRYSIHEYNREDVLMLVLPYHESNIFVRVIQLLKINNEKDPWFFLKTLQKPGIHLPKQSLLNHAANDPYFIKFVSKFILEIIKVHEKPSSLTVAFNFYCSIFTGAIEYSKTVPEPTITQMLPALLKGLSSDIADFRAASYVIIARLVTKCTLSEIILNKFVEKIANHKVETLKEEAVLVYLVLYQSQINFNNIPDEALGEIINQEWFPKILQDLNHTGCFIYPFLEVLIKCSIRKGLEEDGENYRRYTIDLLNQLKIDQEYVTLCLNAIIDSVPSKLKKISEDTKSWLIELIETIEKQYPHQFDKQVYKILTSTENENRKNKLQKILKNALMFRKKFDIFNKLYHSNALIRTNAMKFLSTNFDTLKEDEKDVLKVSLGDRLKDDDIEVVKEALIIVQSTNALKGQELKEILVELLYKFYKDKNYWRRILERVIQMLCTSENARDFQVILNIFPLLLPKSNEGIVYAKLVVKSDLFSHCPLFVNFNTQADLESVGDFPNHIFSCLKSVKSKTIVQDFFHQAILSKMLHKFWMLVIKPKVRPCILKIQRRIFYC